jgi:hypothetical protein
MQCKALCTRGNYHAVQSTMLEGKLQTWCPKIWSLMTSRFAKSSASPEAVWYVIFTCEAHALKPGLGFGVQGCEG